MGLRAYLFSSPMVVEYEYGSLQSPSKLSQMAAFKVQWQSLFQTLQSPYGSLQYSFQALQSSFNILQSPEELASCKNTLKVKTS